MFDNYANNIEESVELRLSLKEIAQLLEDNQTRMQELDNAQLPSYQLNHELK